MATKPVVMFDSMGAQVQVQAQTGKRLITWKRKLLEKYTVGVTDYRKPIPNQLRDAGAVVAIITTHQYTSVPANSTPPPIQPNPIPKSKDFSYSSDELNGFQKWVYDGGGLLLFVNHSAFKNNRDPLPSQGPFWPINDIQLAAALGITTVFASFGLTLPNGQADTMYPDPAAPSAIIANVRAVQAWDSGGILPPSATLFRKASKGATLIPLPGGCVSDGCQSSGAGGAIDRSGLDYDSSRLAFAALYLFGKGNVIVIGHSGICGDDGTNWPSPGQIGAIDNLQFLMNCVAYLATTRNPV